MANSVARIQVDFGLNSQSAPSLLSQTALRNSLIGFFLRIAYMR